MTREEAKDYIREWCPYDRQEEIIKALEQEPCEDCISREQAIRIAEQGQLLGYEWQFKELCKLPSIQPKTDVLDKIRAEIDRQEKWLLQAGCTAYNVDIALDAIKAVVAEKE